MNITEKLYGGKGFVTLMDTIPSVVPSKFKTKDYWIVEAAFESTDKQAEDDIQVYKMIEKLFEWGHFSPFEHARLYFRIKAPLVVFWQLDRHRTFQYGSHLRRSGRYTKFSEEDFYIPSYFEGKTIVSELKTFDEPEKGVDAVSELEYQLAEALDIYEDAIKSGMRRESARFFLPAWCMMYTERMSVDLKNLMHFLALRMDMHAQIEIRELASVMYDITCTQFPYTMKLFKEGVTAPNYNFGGE